MAASEYSVGEGDGSVEVCAELTSVPVGGLECEISVTLAFSDGTKTGNEDVFIIMHALYRLNVIGQIEIHVHVHEWPSLD